MTYTHPQAFGPPQPEDWGNPTNHELPWGQTQATGGSKGTQQNKEVKVNGVPVLPAVVVFGEGSKKKLKASLASIDLNAASAIVSIREIKNGKPRSVLMCKSGDISLVQSLVHPLRATGVTADYYKDQNLANPKAQFASNGLMDVSRKAGVCHSYSQGVECSHLKTKGYCTFVCYNGQPNRRC